LMDNGKMLLDIAHLIDHKCVERYHNKFTSTSAIMRECQMQLSGPWPPYHFVHKLTRPVHAQTQAPATVRVPATVSPETPVMSLMEPTPAFV
jgi:hypothetical protein